MPYQILADMVVVIHLLFILFVIFGGLISLGWIKFAWLHLAAVCWGVIIELSGWVCPLTPLENWMRMKSVDSEIYQTGFVEHYLIPVIYPQDLTRNTQWVLALTVIIINVLIYSLVFFCRKKQSGN